MTSLKFRYRNHRGEIADREISGIPRLWYGATEWHREPQWFLGGHDVQKHAFRDFALKDILWFGDPQMTRYRKRPIEIEAARWFKNGDHPLDYAKDRTVIGPHGPTIMPAEECRLHEWEGAIVRYFRRPGVDGARACEHCHLSMFVHGWIDTKEGGHIVCPGDWIIQGIAGEFYPCKPDIFAATYDGPLPDGAPPAERENPPQLDTDPIHSVPTPGPAPVSDPKPELSIARTALEQIVKLKHYGHHGSVDIAEQALKTLATFDEMNWK